jgi:hypothetical protein
LRHFQAGAIADWRLRIAQRGAFTSRAFQRGLAFLFHLQHFEMEIGVTNRIRTGTNAVTGRDVVVTSLPESVVIAVMSGI